MKEKRLIKKVGKEAKRHKREGKRFNSGQPYYDEGLQQLMRNTEKGSPLVLTATNRLRIRAKENLVSAMLAIDEGDDCSAILYIINAERCILPLAHKRDDAHGSCNNYSQDKKTELQHHVKEL